MDPAIIKAGEFADAALNAGVDAAIPGLGPEAALMRGRNGFARLREGLLLHYADSEHLCELAVDAESEPHLGVNLFLSGSVDAWIGSTKLPMPVQLGEGERWRPVGLFISQNLRERFIRRSRRGARLRKVAVTIAREWLFELAGLTGDGRRLLQRLADEPLTIRSWTPDARAVSLAEQLINPPDQPELMRRLYLESRVIALIEDALWHVVGSEGRREGLRTLRPHERKRLERVTEFVEANGGGPLDAESLAREAGISASSLQRLVRDAHGMPVMEFIRGLRLDKARHSLEAGEISIAEAAHAAGYSTTANFSTAFKRRFGVSPRTVRILGN
ncbi:MAG: helix-turn-helix domain-containing protein [Flavobacteriaceae bacterium]